MREIKFRAWVKRKNELIYLKGFRYSGNEKIKITFADEDKDDCTYTFLNKDVYLEQFTGLHDKNGKEIYEGDIIKGHEWEKGKSHRHIGVVEYIGSSFKSVGINKYLGFHGSVDGSYEVIGNIYENPNLLEEPHEN